MKKIKVIPVKDGFIGGGSRKLFSAWYIPKENVIIRFNYAMHQYFMRNYLPAIRNDKDDYQINKSYNPIDKYIKKVAKKVENTLKKEKAEYAIYNDLYKLGWIRINNDTNEIVITNLEKKIKKEDVNKILMWFKDEIIKPSDKFIINISSKGNYNTIRDYDELPNSESAALEPISGNELVDKVRNKMFGTNIYTKASNESRTFSEIYELLCG